jgi:hypothetical protein
VSDSSDDMCSDSTPDSSDPASLSSSARVSR